MYHFLSNVSPLRNGKAQNAQWVKVMHALVELLFKAIIVCLYNHVKMDLSGIQYTLDVFAHQALLIMEIDVYNVPMIKNGFQA